MSNLTERLLHGDALEMLRSLDDNSVDSVVTDPPYGLSKEPNINEVLTKWLAGEPYDHGHGGFMGKAWDSFVPHPDIWREVYRVLKPGGHALVFAGTRTQDLMTVSLRMAGFEARDVIEWLYFSGFPKSMDVGKAFDKRAGAEREVIGEKPYSSPDFSDEQFVKQGSMMQTHTKAPRISGVITAPTTELARKWDGWGTALKPAHEPIIVVRKPLVDAETGRKLTVVDCVEKYGTGAINIDNCRIEKSDEDRTNYGVRGVPRKTGNIYGKMAGVHSYVGNEARFPANCITTDSDAFYSRYFNVSPMELSKKASKRDRNSDWRGEEIILTEAVTTDGRKKSIDNAFNRGQTERKNSHPTVKPTDLMTWLVHLVTPPNGITLDPFAGSGSTLVAAKREGFGYIGIEREAEYIEIIEARVGISRKEAVLV